MDTDQALPPNNGGQKIPKSLSGLGWFGLLANAITP